MKIGIHNIIRCNEAALGTIVDGEVVLMSPDRGRFYGFDLIASDIWRRVQDPISVLDLSEALSAIYDAPPAEIAADLLSFFELLLDEGLIEVVA